MTEYKPTILITGGHSGIGLECSRYLAAHDHANLILAGRSPERMQALASELQAKAPIKVHLLELDVSSLESVRAAAAQVIAWLESGEIASLDALLCNAGARFMGPVTYSADGYEQTFATNCLGHFLLMELLTDHLSEQGRIIFTASGTHDPATADGRMVGAAVTPDALALANDGKDGSKPLSSGVRYSTSKLCLLLYTYEAYRRLRTSGSGVTVLAYDPGFVSQSEFTRSVPAPLRWLTRTPLMELALKRAGITMGSLDFSGASLARLATQPEFADQSGQYFQANDGRLSRARSSAQSYDEASALKLWNDSRALAGLKDGEGARRLR